MAKNKRECPALGQLISSARCGEERGSVIACPEDCAYYPFGRPNYDQYEEIESRLIQKCMRRFVEESGIAAVERLQRALARLGGNKFLEYGEAARIQFFDRDAAGRTFVERWQAAKFAGLNQDEQRMLIGMAGTRLSLLEIHRQIDDHTVEAVDLFFPEAPPILVVDRMLAGNWTRFATYLAWNYDAPHYRRLSGAAMGMPELGDSDPDEVLTAIVAHLGGPASLSEAGSWLTDNLKRFAESLEASGTALREAMINDMHVRMGMARYRWADPSGRASLTKRLRTTPGLEPGTLSDEEIDQGWSECWDVLGNPPPPDGKSGPTGEAKAGEIVEGFLLLGDQGVHLQTSPGTGYEQLKRRFEALAESTLIFESERTEDFGSQLRQQNRVAYDPALVPPALLARPKQVGISAVRVPADETKTSAPATDFLQHHYSGFADRPLAGLDQRTPRQAAADPALRPRLVRLMKRHLHGLDQQAQKTGEVVDIGWLLNDLGLEEINFPPPPDRDGPDEDWDDEDDEDDEDGTEYDDAEEAPPSSLFVPADWDYDPSVVATIPPGRELSEDDVVARVADMAAESENESEPGKIVTALRAWPGFHEICATLAGELNRDEFLFLVIHFYQAAAVLHPVPPSGARLHPGRVLHYFDQEQRRMTKMFSKTPKTLPDGAFVGDCPQPNVAQWLTEVVLELTEDVKKSKRSPKQAMKLRLPSAIIILCFLRASIRELCHWPVR